MPASPPAPPPGSSANVLPNFLEDVQHLASPLPGKTSLDVAGEEKRRCIHNLTSEYDIAAFISRLRECRTIFVAVQGRVLLQGSDAMVLPRNIDHHVNLITVLAPEATEDINVINVHNLYLEKNDKAINTLFKNDNASTSLRAIFQNKDITKVFWDSSVQGGALRALFKWNLRNVVDLQMQDWMVQVCKGLGRTQPPPRSMLECLGDVFHFPFPSAVTFVARKLETESLFEHNVVASKNPSDKTLRYCADQVGYLPALRGILDRSPVPPEMSDWKNGAGRLTQARLGVAWERRCDGPFGGADRDNGLLGQGRGAESMEVRCRRRLACRGGGDTLPPTMQGAWEKLKALNTDGGSVWSGMDTPTGSDSTACLSGVEAGSEK